MKQYFLPLILSACASQTPIITNPQSNVNPHPNANLTYQKMPEIGRVNAQYTTLKESLAEIIVLSAIDQGVFNTTCITGDVQGVGRLRLIKNPYNTKQIEEVLQNSLPKIDQNKNYFLSKSEITQYSNSVISRYCTLTTNNMP